MTLESIHVALNRKDPDLSPGEALGLLSPARFPEAVAVLTEVLEDPERHTPLRSGAAIVLGRIESADAERVLLRNVDRVPEPVRAEILRSLGQIGTLDALPAVLEARAKSEGATAETARFASILISCRFHLDIGEWPEVPPTDMLDVPAERQVVVRADPPSPDRARQVLSDLQQYPSGGVRLSPENMVELRCRGETNVLCLNHEVSNENSADLLMRAPTLLAVVALESPETSEFSVSFVVLTNPADESVRVAAFRCSGKLALAGVGRRTKEGLDFSLRSVARPGALPIEVRATFTGGRLEVTSATAGVDRLPARIPRAGVPPRPRD